jgi:L-ornithine Nalpha-acyltransferase
LFAKNIEKPYDHRETERMLQAMTQNGTEFSVKLAETPDEMLAAQRLRHRVFVRELGASTDRNSDALGIEQDGFDTHVDHLILQDKSLPKASDVVGVYRLLRSDVAAQGIGFYSADEFQLDKIAGSGRNAVELGRSCVDARYRGGLAMHLLWKGLAEYVAAHDIEILFGVASFHGTDPAQIAHALSFLHHNYLAPDDLRVTAYGSNAIPMDILTATDTDRATALMQIPPLIKSYLRLGGAVGNGAYIDHDFNTIDVCLVMDTLRMSQKYKDFYRRDSAA